ncbi:MAG: hypothetical protein FD169_630 [Bacillota bacterium]|nr:MAG: hypothetical protein FD169_630 [Bacillota bacterium]
MSKQIGFDRFIKLQWAEDLAWRMRETKDEVSLKRIIAEDILSKELPTQETRRKTSIVLLKAFYRIPPQHERLRNEALELLPQVGVNEAKALYWGLMLLAFPIFTDTARHIGQLFSLQSDASAALVQRRVIETWGQRGSLHSTLNKVVKTMAEWGCIDLTDHKKVLVPKAPTPLGKPASLWLTRVALTVSETPLVPVDQALRPSICFPFTMDIHAQDFSDGEFLLQRMDGRTEYVGLRHRL